MLFINGKRNAYINFLNENGKKYLHRILQLHSDQDK